MQDPELLETVMKRQAFKDGLRSLINRHSQENGSDTPDFILADYLVGCLSAFDTAVRRRTELGKEK